MRCVIVLCFWFLSKTFIYSQFSNVRFTIISNATPVSYAQVVIPDIHLGASCDSLGNCIIENVPYGKHSLEVSSIGYHALKQTIIIEKPEQFYKLQLHENLHELNELVVTGSMREISKTESVVPVEVYSTTFFQKNPTPSLLESVEQINGVRPQMQCNVCNTGDIHINGMEGPYTLVLIDGMPIVSGLGTVYGLHAIPNSIIERVEVVKGAAGALYGSEAMGGIINVITKHVLSSPRLYSDVFYSGIGDITVDVSTKYKLHKNIQGLLSAGYYHFNNRIDHNNDQFTDAPLTQRFSVFNKYSLSTNNKKTGDIAFRYIQEDRFGGQLNWQKKHKGTDEVYGESIFTERYEILGNYMLPIPEKVYVNVSYNRHFQDSYYGTTYYKAIQNIGFAQAYWDKRILKNDVMLGLSYRNTRYDDNTPATFAAEQNTNKVSNTVLYGVFVQNEFNASPNIKGIAGLRYDYSTVHKHIVSPRIGFKYKPGKYTNIRLNSGKGFRNVHVFSEDHAALTGGRNVWFKNELKPEQSWNTNLNITSIVSVCKSVVHIDMSIFYTYFSNKIIADYFTDPNLIIYDNLSGYAENKGISLQISSGANKHFQYTLGTTYLQSYWVDQNIQEEMLFTPNLTHNYSISYSLPSQNMVFDFTGVINSPMRLPVLPNDYRPEYSPWYNISNFKVSRKVYRKNIEIYAGVKNMFNFIPTEDVIMRWFDPFDKDVDNVIQNPFGYTFDPSYNYASLLGRRIFIGVKATLY